MYGFVKILLGINGQAAAASYGVRCYRDELVMRDLRFRLSALMSVSKKGDGLSRAKARDWDDPRGYPSRWLAATIDRPAIAP